MPKKGHTPLRLSEWREEGGDKKSRSKKAAF